VNLNISLQPEAGDVEVDERRLGSSMYTTKLRLGQWKILRCFV